MWSSIKYFLNKYCWCLPVLIVTLGTVYYINLFERLSERDLSRQMNEKYQLMNLIENFKESTDKLYMINAMDTFDDTYVYVITDTENTEDIVDETFHTLNCPFKFKTHPFEIPEIKNQIHHKKFGAFVYGHINNVGNIYWRYRPINLNSLERLLFVGISNYEPEPIDKELQISIGFLLLLTAVLNWVLVGYYKYLRSGKCKIVKKEENN